MTDANEIKQKLEKLQSEEQLMLFFEIDFESRFIAEHRRELLKRFKGNVIISKPKDWFDYRRCLKNAYCRIQRSTFNVQH